MILFNNDMKECENTKKNILKEIQKILIGNKFSHHEGKLDSDPLGKYIMDNFFFDNGDSINVTCYDYSEKSGYKDVLYINPMLYFEVISLIFPAISMACCSVSN